MLPSSSHPSRKLLQIVLILSTLYARTYAQQPSASLRQADADYRAGVAALNRNDLKTATAKFEEVVRLAPEAEQGHSALGAVLVRQGQTVEGMRELQKALSIKPTDGSAQLNLALAYQQTDAAAKALPLFAKLEASAVADKHPLPSYVLVAYSKALLAVGQSLGAIAKIKQAVALEPKSYELHDELGTLYAQNKDWQQAALQFKEAIRLSPTFAIAHLHYGFVLEAQHPSDGVSEWMQAWKLAPGNAHIVLAVGSALAESGLDEQAVPVLEDAVKADAHSAPAAYQLGLVLQRVNRVQDAIVYLTQAVDAEPDNADALTNLGMAYSQLHQATKGIPFLQRSISIAPQNAIAHQNLAAAYIQLNQIDEAIVELKAALKLTPDSPQQHYNLGVAYKLKDDATNAIPELEAAEKLNASAPEPPYVLGTLYMQAGRYADAQRELELSLKLKPENGEGWATLGSVYSKLGMFQQATAALREATRQMPDQPDPHLTLAAVLAKENLPSEAAEERKKGAELMRAHMNRQRAEVAVNSGKSLMVSGKLDDAITQFRDALKFDSNYAEAHLELANALEKQGNIIEAASERKLAERLAKGQ
jgi:protein O-GlcNAc transferase